MTQRSPGLSRREALSGLAIASLLAALPSALRAQAAPIVCKFLTRRGRVWIGVKINGEGPFPFIIDTGAHLSLIEEATAKRLKLPAKGYTRMNGAGGRETLPVYATHDVEIGGGIRDNDVVFAALDRRVAPEAIGTLSAGMMTQIDSDLDFAADEWRLYPGGRPDREGFAQVASDITHVGSPEGSAYIFAWGTVNGQRQFDFLLDTGAPQALYLGPSATKRSGLWDDTRPFVPMRRSGIGGVSERISRMVRAESFQIGDIRFDRPLLMISDPDQPDPKKLREGIIGLPLLQQMILSTDVRAGKLWVKGHGGAAPQERYGMSGLWLDQQKGGVTVAAVGTGSPAQAAGVRVGDVVVGKSLGQVIPLIGQSPGTEVVLPLRGPGGEREVRFNLTPYL